MPRKKAPPRRNDAAGVEASPSPAAPRGKKRPRERVGARPAPADAPLEVRAVARLVPRDAAPRVVARLTGTDAARDAPARPDTTTEPRARAAFVRFEASPDGRELRWRFVTSDDAPDAADSPIDPDAASVAPATAAASASSSSTSWLADRPPGAPEAARAFVELVRGGELAIAAEEADASPSSLSSSSSSLLVALADAAFRHPPTHPEEWSRRRAHARLRAALAWLAPPDSRVDRIAAGIEAIAPPSLAATDEIRGGEETIPNAATEKEGSLTAGGPSPKAPKTDPKTAPKTRTAALDDAIRGVYDAARPPPPPPPPPPRAGESRDARSPAQKSFLPRDFPELRPTPRGYQRRAVEWMIRREKGGLAAETKRGERASDDDVGDDDAGYGWFAGSGRGAAATHPLWRPLRRLGDDRAVENAASSASSASPPPAAYVNWHTGQVSLEAFGASEDVRGGVLADEMGLGKTVELLMCVLAHRFPRGDEEERPAKTDDAKGSEPAAAFAPKGEARDAAPEAKNPSIIGDAVGVGDEEKGLGSEAAAAAGAASRDSASSESEGEEVVGCACGDRDANYDGMWLACDDCGEWSHARCVGYTKADERRLAAAHAEEEKNKTTREVGDGENKPADASEFFEPPAFTCGRCAARRAGASFSGPCGATLVVCPSPILEQWRSELARHAAPGALRVATYEGQPRDFGGPGGWRLGTRRGPAPVSAAELAAADVVLTTYETLRRDIHRDPGGPGAEEDDEIGRGGGRRRGRRRYEPLPTPLTRLRWWRVVLDEAQEVESSTAKAAEMARLIPGVNRWCVTGTPVSRGLEDLQGLFAFLGAPSPLTDAGWFRRVAKAPYDAGVLEARDAMHAVARRMMWRHARRDVEDELGLPPQSQIVTRLSASGIEAHWYARQRRVCAGAAREALRRVREARAGAKKSAPAAILRGDDEDAETDEDAREERRSRTPAWARAGVGRRLGGGDGSRERGGEEDERGDEEEGEDDRDEREARSDERGVDEEGDATAATAGSERVVVDDAPSAVDLTSDDARASAADADDLRALTPEESRRVLLPLLRLRQACNHPQAGAHGVRGVARVGGGGGGGGARRSRDAASFVGAGGVHHGAIMTMPEIHAVLIEKQRIEAEEAQRLVAFARNASAGVATCLGGAENRRVAVEHYREVLRLDAAGATDGLGLRLDALQRLHALHNLKLALDAVDEEEAAFKIRHSESETPGEKTAVPYRGALPSAPFASPFAGVSRTLRDASLESDAALVRAEYLAKRAGGVGAALTAFRDAVKATNDARLRSGATGPGPAGATWWFAVLDREARRAPNNTNAANNPNAFVDRLARGALGGSWQGRAVAFTDAAGLRFQLESDLARVGSMREAFLERVRTLTERTAKADPADVDAAGRCQVCVSLDGGGDGGGAAFGGVSRANRAGVVRAARVVCRHCVAEAENAEYEDVVFGKQSDAAELYGNARGRVARGDVGAGRSAPSSAETALRVLATKCQDERDIYMPSDTSGAALSDASGPGLGRARKSEKSEAAAHLETMEGIRREFRCASTLLKRQSLELKARDELAMATTRIRVRAAHEVALGGVPDPVPEHLRASVVHDWELEDLARGYELDRATYEADLRKAASQVRFLERLRSEDQTNGGAEEEEEEEDLEEEEDAEGGKAEERGGEDVAPRRKKSSEVAPRRKKRAALREAKTFECPVCQEDVDGSASAAQLAVLPCGHRLCVACTDALVARAPAPPPRRPRRFKCPTCREPADADEVNYVSFGSKKPRVRREHPRGDGDPPGGGSSSTTGLGLEKAAAAALSSAIGTPEEHERGEALLAVRGSWGTKIEAVTRRVLWLLDPARPGADAATKVLVFSEWEDALRVVCAALRANGVDAEHPAGGGRKLRDAIQRFKRGENRPSASSANGTERGGAFDDDEKDEEDGADGEEKARRRGLPGASEAITPEARSSSEAVPESPPAPRAPLLPPPPSSAPSGPGPGRVARSGPRALLLPLRRGANGLNLTEAQHVILLEPVLDHGAEAQATKRVDRIGQTRPTCVHRFLLQGTVEENVQALSNRRKEAARSAAGSARGAAKGITVAEAEMLIPRAGG